MEEKVDITKYPEGPQEVIKYMDYLPDDEQTRMKYLFMYVNQCLF